MGDLGLSWLGVLEGAEAEYVPREVDDVLVDRMAGNVPLLVVTGAPQAGATRSAGRAARRMLGDQRVVAPRQIVDADVATLIASRADATVVWLDGAPLGVLDQLTPALVDAAQSAGVRIVVTTRSCLVGFGHPEPGTGALLRAATVEVGALTDAEVRGSAYVVGGPIGRQVLPGAAADRFVVPVGWHSLLPLAVARVAATWEGLGIPLPLTPGRLASLVPAALEELDDDAAASAETIAAEIRRCAREPVAGLRVLRTTSLHGETHLRPHPLLSAATTTELDLDDLLGDRLTPAQRSAVARAAVLIGDDETAAELLDGLEAHGLDPSASLRVAMAMGRTPWAEDWYRRALDGTSDPAERRLALAGVANLLDVFADDRPEPARARAEARKLMEEAVPDQRALIWLGRKDRERRDVASARARWATAVEGPEEWLAARAAWLVATIDIESGDDAAALPFLERARSGDGWDRREVGLALGGVQERLGDVEAAEDALCRLLGGPPVRDNPILLELGRAADARGDTAAARRWYGRVFREDIATLRLAEIDLEAGRLKAVIDRIEDEREFRSVFDDSPAAAVPKLRFETAERRAWGAWLAGEAAYQLGDLEEAAAWLEAAWGAPGDRADRAELRRGQLLLAQGDVVEGCRRLEDLARSGGPAAAEAAVQAAAVSAEARRQAAYRRPR